jgi:hypothetical protein
VRARDAADASTWFAPTSSPADEQPEETPSEANAGLLDTLAAAESSMADSIAVSPAEEPAGDEHVGEAPKAGTADAATDEPVADVVVREKSAPEQRADTAGVSTAQDEPADKASLPGDMETSVSADDDEAPVATLNGDAAVADREVTVVPGVPRYHRAECILIRFMAQDDLESMLLQSAAETGYTPCRACQPDQADSATADS